MTDYKPGDRVRVTFEAEVLDVSAREYTYLTLDTYPEVNWWADDPGVTIEKLTPDYKAQIEALEPGTAFVLTRVGKEFTYLRIDRDRMINKMGKQLFINEVVWLHSVTDLRILK